MVVLYMRDLTSLVVLCEALKALPTGRGKNVFFIVPTVQHM